jgi:D-alanyl-D-alanine carboxypeptidase (penicillin-binding protein 5/6)
VLLARITRLYFSTTGIVLIMAYSTAFRSLLLPLFLVLAWLGLGWTTAHAQTIPPPPSAPVRSYILMDYQSGNLLAEMKGDERMEPASITKLMTGYVIYKALKSGKIRLEDQVTISEKAWRTQGSKMFVKIGSQVSVEDLLMGMVVQSGNDATVALAEHVAGSEETFAKLMNQEAEQLGLKQPLCQHCAGNARPESLYVGPRHRRVVQSDYPGLSRTLRPLLGAAVSSTTILNSKIATS